MGHRGWQSGVSCGVPLTKPVGARARVALGCHALPECWTTAPYGDRRPASNEQSRIDKPGVEREGGEGDGLGPARCGRDSSKIVGAGHHAADHLVEAERERGPGDSSVDLHLGLVDVHRLADDQGAQVHVPAGASEVHMAPDDRGRHKLRNCGNAPELEEADTAAATTRWRAPRGISARGRDDGLPSGRGAGDGDGAADLADA